MLYLLMTFIVSSFQKTEKRATTPLKLIGYIEASQMDVN